MIKPMLCGSRKKDEIPTGDNWVHEVKYDGIRALAVIEGGKIVKMQGRSNPDIASRYPELVGAKVAKSNVSCVIDGEVCVFNKDGTIDFNGIQHREQNEKPFMIELMAKKYPVMYCVFDIIEYQGKSIRCKTLAERRKLLEATIIPFAFLKLSEQEYDGKKLFAKQVKCEGEGIISKELSGTYDDDKRTTWIKIKYFKEAKVRVNSYLINPRGIKAIGTWGKCQVTGRQAEPLKTLIDKNGSAEIEIQFLNRTESGAYRMPTYRGLVG